MTNTVLCYVLGDNVTVTTDLQGEVKNIACPHYVRMTGSCALKLAATADESGGSLAANVLISLVKKTADRKLGTRTNYCEFTDKMGF